MSEDKAPRFRRRTWYAVVDTQRQVLRATHSASCGTCELRTRVLSARRQYWASGAVVRDSSVRYDRAAWC